MPTMTGARFLAETVHGYGLTVIWGLQVGYRALQAAIFATFWLRRRWARIEI